jgi:hypothetical protein
VVESVAAGTLFLGLTLASLHLFIMALGELALLLETPFWAKSRLRRWLSIDQVEGGVIFRKGWEGLIIGEVEDRV